MILSGRHRYAAVLAIISILILAIGLLLKPPQRKRVEDLVVTRAELENLRQLVRRNSLRNLATTFTSVGDDAVTHLSLFRTSGTNGVLLPGIGLVVAKGLDSLPRDLSLDGKTFIPSAPWTPGLPFFVASSPAGMDPATIAASAPSQGSWVLLVAGAANQALLSPGLYNGEVQSDCGPFLHRRLLTTIPLTSAFSGGGLFDLTGDLHGLVLSCDDGLAIVPINEIRRGTTLANSDFGVLLARYGIRLAKPPDTTEGGAIISEVWDHWPADKAGIEPGDLVIAVDGQKSSALEQFQAFLVANPPIAHELQLHRGQRRITVPMELMSVQWAAETRPALIPDGRGGVPVERVTRFSSADRAGIRSSDRILSINGNPATASLVEQTFEQFQTDKLISVVVQRPGRRLQLQVQP